MKIKVKGNNQKYLLREKLYNIINIKWVRY